MNTLAQLLPEMLDRRPVVEAATGKRKSQLYDDIASGLFTAPVAIGARAVAWPRSEVQQIIFARIAGRSDDQIRALVTELHAKRRTAR